MAVKTGTCGIYVNPLTGAVSDNRTLFVPAIGERGRITVSNPSGENGFLAYAYNNSTTLGALYDGYIANTHTDYSCVFDYIRKGNGVTELTYVSGNAGGIASTGGNDGGIYLVANIDDMAFPAAPIDPGAPYTNASGLVAGSRNPSSGLYKNAGAADWSSTYSVFCAGWARESNLFVGDENNV